MTYLPRVVLVSSLMLACTAFGAGLQIGSVTGTTGTTVVAPLTFKAEGARISALEWTISFPPSMVSAIEVSAGTAAAGASKTITCITGSAGKHRCVLAGLNNFALADGSIAMVSITIGARAPGTSAVGITEAIGATPDGNAFAVSAGAGTITVPAPPPTPTPARVAELACPATLTAGATGTCQVKLDKAAPAGGTVTSLGFAASGSVRATIPVSLTVPAGSSSATFPVQLVSGAAGTKFSITASSGSSSRTVWITTTAAPPECSFSLSTPPLPVTDEGAMVPLVLTASKASCAWTADSDSDWAQIAVLSGSGTTSTTIQVLPNFSTATRRAVVRVAELSFPITQNGATAASSERFVRLLYYSFFGRIPSPPEVAFQVDALNATGQDAQMTLAFFTSPEFNIGGRFIAGLYVGLLNRDAEYSGWVFQRNAVSRGLTTPEALVGGFMGTPEYAMKFGNPSDADFVRLLYRHVLLREPTPAEVAFQAKALVSNTTRSQLAGAFLNSEEFREGTGPRLSAFLMYACLLQRNPSTEELALWAGMIERGVPMEAVIESFLSGAEMSASLH